MNIVITNQFNIRQFNEDDAPFVLHILNTPGWIEFIGDRRVRNLEDSRKYIIDKFVNSYTKSTIGIYLVELKDKKIAIGMCGLIKRDILEHVDIGFAFLPEYEGKGYAFEAASAIMQYATNTLHLNPILAMVIPSNKKSIALLQKLNFHFEKMIIDEGEQLMLLKNESSLYSMT